MALTDSDAYPLRDNGPAAEPAPRPTHISALDRLPILHGESVRAARLTRFLGHAIGAAWALMLGAGATLVAGGGRSLPENFAWSALVLLAVLALTRTYMRAFAVRRGPVESLAADLRATILYAGFAWGAGAFLALPTAAGPASLVLFAAIPTLLIAAVMRDRGAVLLFAAPTAMLCASAAILDVAGGLTGAVTVLAVQGVIVMVTLLASDRAAARTLPPGFALR